MRFAARFVFSLFVVSAAACGGGGSGGVSPIPTNLVAVDDANAPAVSGGVIQASDTVFSFGKTGAAAVQSVSSAGAAPAFSLAALAKWQLSLLTSPDGPLYAAGVGTLPAAKVPCAKNQGTVSVTDSTVTPGGAPTAGDSYSMSFAGCFVQDTQSTLNGSLTMRIVTANGNPLTDPAWSVSAKLTFSNLSSSDINGIDTFKGGYSFTLSAQGVTYNGIIQTDSFTETRGKLVQGLRHLSVKYTVDNNTQTYTLDLHGLYGSSALNGAVNFDSEAAFNGAGKDWPTTGRLKISGANNTSVTLVPAPPNGAQLGIDSNGDGTPEKNQSVSWVSLVTG